MRDELPGHTLSRRSLIRWGEEDNFARSCIENHHQFIPHPEKRKLCSRSIDNPDGPSPGAIGQLPGFSANWIQRHYDTLILQIDEDLTFPVRGREFRLSAESKIAYDGIRFGIDCRCVRRLSPVESEDSLENGS